MIEKHLENAGADVRSRLNAIPIRAFPGAERATFGWRWPVFAASFAAVLAVGIGMSLVLGNQPSVATYPPGTTPAGAACVDPPDGEVVKSTEPQDLSLAVNPSEVTAGGRARLALSVTPTGVANGISPTIGLATFWQCWDGSEWVDMHLLIKGVLESTSAVLPPDSAVIALGLGLPVDAELLIPEVGPGTYRIRERLWDDGRELEEWTIVTVIGPEASPPPSDDYPVVVEQDGVYLLVGSWSGGESLLAALGGTLAVGEGGCLGLAGLGDFVPAVWPAGTQFTSDGPMGIVVPEAGTFRLGDVLESAGGYGTHTPESHGAIPASCIQETTEVAIIMGRLRLNRSPAPIGPDSAASCPTEPRGSEAPVNQTQFSMGISEAWVRPGDVVELWIEPPHDTTEQHLTGLGAVWQCWNGTQWVDTHMLRKVLDGQSATPVVVPSDGVWSVRTLGVMVPSTVRVSIPDVPPGWYRIVDSMSGYESRSPLYGYTLVEVRAPRPG